MFAKRNYFFILFFILFIHQSSKAQITIVPELSDNIVQRYIAAAQKYYPHVKAFEHRINAANALIDRNKLSLLEAITVSYIYQPGVASVDPTHPTTSYFQGFQAGIFLNLGTLFERPFIAKQSREELAIIVDDHDEYLITLATQVKKRYYVYVQRLGELKLQTKSLQDGESSLKDIRYKFEKGEETFDNYNKAQSDYTNHQVAKILAESNLFAARADVEELIGTKMENIK